MLRVYLIIFLLLNMNFSLRAEVVFNDEHKDTCAQHGAKLFLDNCFGCHSLKYTRLTYIIEDLHAQKLLLSPLHAETKMILNKSMMSALSENDARNWFGTKAPDLSLVILQKGRHWVFKYLNGFYKDDSRPFYTNNSLVPNVAMPDIIYSILQKNPSDDTGYKADINLSNQKKIILQDLICFLDYVSEPEKQLRYQIGWKVIIFLFFCLGLLIRLKNIYWQKFGNE